MSIEAVPFSQSPSSILDDSSVLDVLPPGLFYPLQLTRHKTREAKQQSKRKRAKTIYTGHEYKKLVRMKLPKAVFFIATIDWALAFAPSVKVSRSSASISTRPTVGTYSQYSTRVKAESVDDVKFESEDEKKEAVGNLVADDEWNGLSMELSEIVRVAIVEDLKKNTREFTGSDNYKVGDITKEIDNRVKDEVANLRGKDEYELGDFCLAMDTLSKKYTEELTGKPYEAGDLSVEIDKRVKNSVADFCGKDEYQVGDLSRAISSRVQDRVEEFTGKPYEFGDVSRQIENKRREWVKDFLGEEAAANYQFGDVTKKFLAGFTGKDEYQFGDVSKKIIGDLFAGKKKK